MNENTMYKDYFDIDENYFPAVNEELINSGEVDWHRFYPHATFIQLLKDTASILERNKKLSIWVEGAYGTGKSHAALTLKKILDADQIETKKYFVDNGIDKDIYNKIQGAKDKGTILTVHRYGVESIRGDESLLMAVQESIKKSLIEKGLEHLGDESLKDAIIQKLRDNIFSNYFDELIENRYHIQFGTDRSASIIEKLETLPEKETGELSKKIINIGDIEKINAFKLSPDNLIGWIKNIIEKNKIKSVIFIWDEFTDFFTNNRDSLTGFQKLLDSSQSMPFHFIIVSHKSESLFNDKDDNRKKILDRFVRPTCEIKLPENMAFKLMGAALRKKDDEILKREWKETADTLQAELTDSSALVIKSANIEPSDLKAVLPIHPYTAIILKYLASLFGSNQRSMFDFIKNKRGEAEDRSFMWYIENHGPMSNDPLLTIDMLWDYFYAEGRANLEPSLKSLLSVYDQNENSMNLNLESRKVLKTILLLQGISEANMGSVEMFRPTAKNIGNAYEGTDLGNSRATAIAQRLAKEKILYEQPYGTNREIQFVAVRTTANEEDLAAKIDEFKKSRKLRDIVEFSEVNDFLMLPPALKLRCNITSATVDNIDKVASDIRSKHWENRVPVVICYSTDDAERAALLPKIKILAEEERQEIIWVDTSLSDFKKDRLEEYYRTLAESAHWKGVDPKLSDNYLKDAEEVVQKWKKTICCAEIRIITHSRNEKVVGAIEAIAKISDYCRNLFPFAIDNLSSFSNMYEGSPTYRMGAKCGAGQETAGIFKSAKIDKNLSEIWCVEKYWISNKSHLLSKIKIDVDRKICESFDKDGRISICEIYNHLKAAPYGFLPCNLSAFVVGFLLKEYAISTYNWSNLSLSEPMSIEKLAEMIEEIIKLDITSNNRYVDKYIVKMSPEEYSFLQATSKIFRIPQTQCSSIEKIINEVIVKVRDLGFPLWALNDFIRVEKPKYCDEIYAVINNYCLLLNKGNDIRLAYDIGCLCTKNITLADIIQSLLTKENCKDGMKLYLDNYKDGELKQFAEKIEDGGNSLNSLKNKTTFDATWLWEKDTINSKIEELIIEYKLIDASCECTRKTSSFKELESAWFENIQRIKLPYESIKNECGDIKDLLGYLFDIAKTGSIRTIIQKQFLFELQKKSSEYTSFLGNQSTLFRRLFKPYLQGLSDNEVEKILRQLPTGLFVKSHIEYQEKISDIISTYKKSLKYNIMRNLWQAKTETQTPTEWSEKNSTPILCMVDDEYERAKNIFDLLNRKNLSDTEIDNCTSYIETAKFFKEFFDQTNIEKCFSEKMLGSYSAILTDNNEVRNYLKKKLGCNVYDWYPNPMVRNIIVQYASDNYVRKGYEKALQKIEDMDADSVKSYLKKLVKDNVKVGIEIIREGQE